MMRFLLVDRVESWEPWVRVSSVKNITRESDYLAQHFPGFPVFPGTLTVEALAQSAGWLIARSARTEGDTVLPMLHSISRCRFSRAAYPGDQLRMDVVVQRKDANLVSVHGTARIGDRVSARAELMLVYRRLDPKELDASALAEVSRMWAGLEGPTSDLLDPEHA